VEEESSDPVSSHEPSSDSSQHSSSSNSSSSQSEKSEYEEESSQSPAESSDTEIVVKKSPSKVKKTPQKTPRSSKKTPKKITKKVASTVTRKLFEDEEDSVSEQSVVEEEEDPSFGPCGSCGVDVTQFNHCTCNSCGIAFHVKCAGVSPARALQVYYCGSCSTDNDSDVPRKATATKKTTKKSTAATSQSPRKVIEAPSEREVPPKSFLKSFSSFALREERRQAGLMPEVLKRKGHMSVMRATSESTLIATPDIRTRSQNKCIFCRPMITEIHLNYIRDLS
jgi:hypothetical protein